MLNKGKKAQKEPIVKNSHTKKVIVAAMLSIIGLVVFSLAQQYTYQAKLESELNAKQSQVQSQLKELDSKSNLTSEQQKQIEQLKKEKEELNKQLQAKRNTARVLAEAGPARVAVSGTCAEWISAAGIGDVANAAELIRRESGCNPNAMNRSSGACGVAQELPCGKSGCSLGDGACQVKWMNRYVLGRYGSWANAVAWHNSHNWY